jgi:bromodomain-containing factor 1
MDEEQEAEKIRQLEERMALFEQQGGVPPAIRRGDDSEHSDSSSSDSSDSDSE